MTRLSAASRTSKGCAMSGETWMVGDVSVTRVEEMCELGFEPEFLYPNWEPAFLRRTRGLADPGLL